MTLAYSEDFLGQRVDIGDFVVQSNGYNGMAIFKILRRTPKMLEVTNILAKRKGKVKLIYGRSVVKIDEHLVMIYLLKRN